MKKYYCTKCGKNTDNKYCCAPGILRHMGVWTVTKNTQYAINKEKAREQAIDWQHNFENQNYSWGCLANWECYFRKLGKRYGLLKEFSENGII